jgi:hypothetical protein
MDRARGERAQRAAGRRRDRHQAPRPEPVENPLGHAERGIAAGDHQPGGIRPRKQPQLSGADHAIGLGPGRPRNPVVGQLGADELLAHAPDPQRRPVAELTVQRRDDLAAPRSEQLLHARAERLGDPQRRVDRGHVPARLHRRDELPAHPGASCQLALREPARSAPRAGRIS